VHHEFAPEGKNVNTAFNVEVLKSLKDRVRRMDRNCGRVGDGFSTTTMPHTHTALIVLEFLARISITVLEHPPYSLDLALYNFFFFPKCCRGGIWGM